MAIENNFFDVIVLFPIVSKSKKKSNDRRWSYCFRTDRMTVSPSKWLDYPLVDRQHQMVVDAACVEFMQSYFENNVLPR